MRRVGERRSESVWEPPRGILPSAPFPGRADWGQAFFMQSDRELPRRAIQRFGGRVFGRAHEELHRAKRRSGMLRLCRLGPTLYRSQPATAGGPAIGMLSATLAWGQARRG